MFRDLMEGRILDIIIMLTIAGLLMALFSCGQYSSADNLIPDKKCYGPNEEACIIYEEEMLCGGIV